LDVDLLIGDLDSVSPEALSSAVRVERHSPDKDATDLELALAAAARLEPESILVLGGAAGRLDHLLGSLLLVAGDAYAAIRVDAQLGPAAVHVIRRERILRGEVGELISLLPVYGPVRGVSTDGLVYPLANEDLEFGSSRGISNVFAGSEARIAIEEGVLLAIRPTGIVAEGSSDRGSI
jgi:thiamine pyrophosphokinase